MCVQIVPYLWYIYVDKNQMLYHVTFDIATLTILYILRDAWGIYI